MIWQNICFNTGNLHISLWINDLLSLYANEYYESLPLKKSKQYLLKTRIFLETTSITNVFRSVLKKLSLKTVKIVWRNKFSGKTRLDLLWNLGSNQWKITTFKWILRLVYCIPVCNFGEKKTLFQDGFCKF